jgi:hypothetical protein
VRPYDLYVNITVEVGMIVTFDVTKGLDLSCEALTFDYDFAPDAITAIEDNKASEAYHNG